MRVHAAAPHLGKAAPGHADAAWPWPEMLGLSFCRTGAGVVARAVRPAAHYGVEGPSNPDSDTGYGGGVWL